MLRDRYAPVDLFALAPALTLHFEPVLARLDELLDDDTLFQAVKRDLARRRPRTSEVGRPATPVEVLLRLLIVRRLYGWSYAETEHFVNDSLVLRQFCRLGLERTPDDTTLLRGANLIQPTTLQQLLDHVVDLARQLKVTRGRKLRVDSTVVQTPIHHPTDSSLLVDGVRLLGRSVRRARPVVAGSLAGVRQAFRTRTRSARRRLQQIHRLARRKDEAARAAQRAVYAQLCHLARQVVRQAERVQQVLADREREGEWLAQRVAGDLQRLLPLVRQVIAQAERRVLQGESVPAEDKVVSLIEPHTAILTRHKPRQPVEFGRKVWLAVRAGSSVTSASWPARRRMPHKCRRVWHAIAASSAAHPTCSRVTAAARRPRSDRRPRRSASAAWPCPTPVHRVRPVGCGSVNAGSSVAIAGVPGSRGASARSSGSMGWRAARTTAPRASSAGSAGAC